MWLQRDVVLTGIEVTPLGSFWMLLDPDVEEIGFCRLRVMNVTHQKRQSGSARRA